MTFHANSKEWRIPIVFLTLAKFTTALFSIFAGYSYFLSMYNSVLQSSLKAVILSIITLIILEVLTAFFLEKTFKFLYRQRFITSLATLFAVAIFYSISFIASTNGLAQKQGAKKDFTKKINVSSDSLKQIAILKNDNLIKEIDIQIGDIKKNPQGWKNNKRVYLQENQLADIKRLNIKKDTLRNQLKTSLSEISNLTLLELSKNDKQVEKTASYFYKMMAGVMIGQFIFTAILIYLYHLVRTQTDKDVVIDEDLKEMSNVIEQNASNVMTNAVVSFANRMNENFNKQMKKQIDTSKIIIEQKNQPQIQQENQPQEIEKKIVRVAGFSNFSTSQKPAEKTSQKTSQKNVKPLSYLNSSSGLSKSDIMYLKKHKLIVKAIKKNQLSEQEKISNVTIKNVQKDARRAIHKGRSTIQKVYLVMRGYGFENIDNSGNLLAK